MRFRFTARQIALLVYEVAEDLDQMGREFRESLTSLGMPEESSVKLNKITKALAAWRRKHHSFLHGSIRNICVSHRDQEALKLLDSINSIEPMRVFEVAAEFYDILRPLIAWLPSVLQESGTLQSMIKDFCAGPRLPQN